MGEILANLPKGAQYAILIFYALMSIVYIVLPFIIIGLNDKVKKIRRDFQKVSDSMLDLGDVIEKHRKDSNINKLADKI